MLFIKYFLKNYFFYFTAYFWLVLFNNLFLGFVSIIVFNSKPQLYLLGFICGKTYFQWHFFWIWLIYFGIKLYFSWENKNPKKSYFLPISGIFFSFWVLDCVFLFSVLLDMLFNFKTGIMLFLHLDFIYNIGYLRYFILFLSLLLTIFYFKKQKPNKNQNFLQIFFIILGVFFFRCFFSLFFHY